MVIKRLSNHPRITVVGDLFGHNGWNGGKEKGRQLRASFGKEFDDLDHRIAHKDEILSSLFNLAAEKDIVGLKHHLNGDEGVTNKLLSDESVAKIMLRRPNILASFSSSRLNAAKKKSAGVDGDAAPQTTVPFDGAEFERFMNLRREVDKYWLPRVQQSAGSHIVVSYNQVRDDAGFQVVLDFLGVNASKLPEQTTEKRNSDDIVSRFSNPDDVRLFLKDHALEDWAMELPTYE